MALSEAQDALLDRILASARANRLVRPFREGNVVATMVGTDMLRLRINGAAALADANAWIGACAQKAGAAARRSSDGNYVILELPIVRRRTVS